MKIFLLCLICFVFVSATEVGVIKTHETNTPTSLETKLRDIKSITDDIKSLNSTNIAVEPKNVLYEKWSKWSKCRNCRKTRKRRCKSKVCNFAIVYEERPCGKIRCKRKRRRKIKMNIIENIGGTKSLEPEVKFWQNEDEWSDWTPCSQNCTTKRYKYCRKPGRCPTKRKEQSAYCFTNGSRCERWIQNLIYNEYANNRKYDISPEFPTHTKKRKKDKIRKCGMMYKNSTYGVATNMLRIIGGRETYKSKWPWHVALLNRYQEVFCGGTLISPKWVVTAAHCVRSVLYATLNEYDISHNDGTEVKFRIQKMYIHPDFNAITIDNDIAMLKLPRTVSMAFACLPKDEPKVGESCTIMGWGKRKMNDFRGSKILREATLPIVSKDVCLRSYRRYVITKNMFCAGYRNGGTDTCSGDSGGGLFCTPSGKRGWTIQGITSFGEGCGKRGKYGIYVTVNNYLDWIKRIMTYK